MEVWNGRLLVWNGRKLPVWNMEKSSSIPYHALLAEKVARHLKELQGVRCKFLLKKFGNHWVI